MHCWHRPRVRRRCLSPSARARRTESLRYRQKGYLLRLSRRFSSPPLKGGMRVLPWYHLVRLRQLLFLMGVHRLSHHHFIVMARKKPTWRWRKTWRPHPFPTHLLPHLHRWRRARCIQRHRCRMNTSESALSCFLLGSRLGHRYLSGQLGLIRHSTLPLYLSLTIPPRVRRSMDSPF